MYIREQGPKDSPDIRLPDNYSGTAFRGGMRHPPEAIALPPGLLSDEGAKYSKDIPPRQPRSYIKKVPPERDLPSVEQPGTEDVKKSSFPDAGEARPVHEEPEPRGDLEVEHKPSHSEQEGHPVAACEKPNPKNPLKGLFSSIVPPGFGKHGEGEFGFEELLLIGLILLLSQSDADNDILLLLALLLFC
ncbi:MAG: hypothetical protein GX057_06765 [Clostridiales bacterium]|nr:hypothetical protein [Clostridiales bacterium]